MHKYCFKHYLHLQWLGSLAICDRVIGRLNCGRNLGWQVGYTDEPGFLQGLGSNYRPGRQRLALREIPALGGYSIVYN